MSRLAFHRPARFRPSPPRDEKVVLPTPPEAEARGGAAIWMQLLLPLLGSLAMAGYMITFGRPLFIIIGIVFVLVAIGTTVGMRAQMRNSTRRAGKRQRTRYASHLLAVRASAREVAAAQRQYAALAHPEPNRLWGIVTTYERVWERRPSDPDFLHIVVGTGEAELATPIQIGTRLDPMADYDWESLTAAEKLVDRMGRVAGQPSVVDIGSAGVVSLLGPRGLAEAAARSILCQIAVLHASDDVGIAVELSGDGEWTWMKWLPHTIEPDATGPAGIGSLVAVGPEVLAAYLQHEIIRRQEAAANRRNVLGLDRTAAAPPPRRLILVLTGFEPVSEWGRSDLLHALLEIAGPATGLTILVLAEREADEPSRVDLRIRLTPPRAVELEGRANLIRSPIESTVASLVTPGQAELIARRLAPLRLSDERDQVLARTVSLSEMLLGGDPVAADITANWADITEQRLLRMPIGNDGDGIPVILDIKESAAGGSGPHGLIVGATGSGKSELLRTLVTGLALTHSPERVSFVLVDFKGGAAFAPLTEMPHVAGLITNLADDSAMIDRVQAALQGEQQRRQQLLRRAGNIDSIRQYQSRLAAGGKDQDGAPLPPLPYLLIIVDEFGELLSGRPEFTDLFVQIGRVGRSLGMHLLLATQRLEEGRLRGLDSHLSYRICLRTFSAAESRTVIGTPDAYRLPAIPGSAYLKVDESIYQRFRVAHVSAPYVSPKDREVAGGVHPPVAEFDIRTTPTESIVEEAPATSEDGPTELAVMVDRLRMVGRPVHQVWLPPLPAAIPMDNLVGSVSVQPGRGLAARSWPEPGRLRIPIGVVDRPLQQEQHPLVMDFGGPHGHLAVVGAPQTGRSTTLRTIMLASMLTHTPEEVQFYCVDFGGGTLHQYAVAPHVGTVVGRNDLPVVRRMFADMRSLIAAREGLFRRLGVDSIADFRGRRSAGQLPPELRSADLFLLIDNWGAVRGELDDADATVADIAARGLGVGVHLVLTASRWMEIRPNLRDSIGTRMELRLNDPSESEVQRRLSVQLVNAGPGRGLAPPGAFFQLLLPRLDGMESVDRIGEAQDDALAKVAAAWSGPGAPPVRMLPARITTEELAALGEPPSGVPIAVAEADLGPVGIDLGGDDRHLLLLGDARSGKTAFLRTLVTGLMEKYSAWHARFVIVDYRRSLLGMVPPDHLGAYAADSNTARAYADQVCAKLRERLPPPDITPQRLRARDWWEGPDVYLIIDDHDLVVGGPGQPSPLAPLVEFIPHARDVGLHVVVARRTTGASRALIGDQLLSRLKEIGCAGLQLAGDPREGVLIGQTRPAARPPGRGVLVRRGQPDELVQVAVVDDGASASATG